MGKLASGLFLTLIVVGSSTGAHAGPWCAFYDLSTYNCGFHSYAQCYATIYGNGDGADKTFSSRPAGIADRARRVRLPAIESLRPPTGLPTLAAPSKAVHASQVINGNISDVVVPRSELS